MYFYFFFYINRTSSLNIYSIVAMSVKRSTIDCIMMPNVNACDAAAGAAASAHRLQVDRAARAQ